MILKKNYSENWIWQFLNKNAQFKNINSFFLSHKKSLKSLYLVILCNLTHLQDVNTKEKFLLRILEKIHVRSGSGTNWKVGSRHGSEKIISDPQHCLLLQLMEEQGTWNGFDRAEVCTRHTQLIQHQVQPCKTSEVGICCIKIMVKYIDELYTYKETKAKCRRLKKLTFKRTLWHVFNRLYGLEIQLVFSTQLC